MRKWVVRLAIITIATVAGVAGAWWYLDQRSEPTTAKTITDNPALPIKTAKTISDRKDTENKKRKSPVLGKEIPGLPEFCADKLISVSGCDGQTEITTDQGNTYRLVEIGNQCWFADNAKEIPDVDIGWYGYYDNAEEEPSPGEGMLYTWDAAMNGETDERAQGVCPDGWHIPSVCEFQALPEISITTSRLFHTLPGQCFYAPVECVGRQIRGAVYLSDTKKEFPQFDRSVAKTISQLWDTELPSEQDMMTYTAVSAKCTKN